MKAKFIFLFFLSFSVIAVADDTACSSDPKDPYQMYQGQCYPMRFLSSFENNDPLACHGKEQDNKEFHSIGLFMNFEASSSWGPKYFKILKEKIKNCGITGDPFMPGFGLKEYQANRTSYLKVSISNQLDSGKIDIHESVDDYESLDVPKEIARPNLKDWKSRIDENKENQKKNCSPVDLRKQFGPIRDQEDSGLCYAFVSSELLGFKLHKKISYMDVAFQAQSSRFKGTYDKVEKLDGGDIAQSIKAAAAAGICTTDQFPDDQNHYNAIKNAIDPIVDPSLFGTCSTSAALTLTPNMKNLLDSQQKINQFSIQAILNKACDPRDKSFSIDPHSFSNQPQVIHGIDEALSKNLPAGVAVRDWKNNAFGQGHAMTVVGRQWNSQAHQCQYILRNSWGPCPYSKKKMEQFEKDNITCDGGYLFINHDDLVDMGRDSAYIE